jgi:Zn-dependent protease
MMLPVSQELYPNPQSPPAAAPGVCVRCAQSLPADALECGQCHALVNEAAVEKIAARARAYEANGNLPLAREEWLNSLRLLPPDSTHAKWVSAHAQELGATIQSVHGDSNAGKWAKRLGPLAPLAVLLAKFKGLFFLLFKLKSFFSLAAFIGLYSAAFGWKFGVGFAGLIFVHEMGHYIDVKRRGLPAEMPVFLPGLGAYVRWQAMGVSLETRSFVSLAGPFAGLLAALACLLWWRSTRSPIAMALAHASALLNILNLIPVWILDGGQAIAAINKAERFTLLLVGVFLWFVTGEMVFLLVSAGALWRMFTRDAPETGSVATNGYFIAVLAGLAWILKLVPGKGVGPY